MTSKRRFITVLALAAGATGFAFQGASSAAAAPIEPINPIETLDTLSASAIPESEQAGMPTVGEQLQGLDQLNGLGELHQLTDQAAPVTGLLPTIY